MREGATARLAAQYELALWTAWHVAAFMRVKKLPAWDSIRPTKKTTGPKRRMTEAEMLQAMQGHTELVKLANQGPRRILRKQDR